MNIQNLPINYCTPKEITRDNWIIGYACENDNDILYEIHYATTSQYIYGLLIDDSWNSSNYNRCSQKIDIYILSNEISSIPDDFELNKIYSFFLPYKIVKKTFQKWNICPDAIKKIIVNNSYNTKYTKKKNKPIVSLVTTVFNNADLLEQTIQSVINQTSCEFEYIIKDANSTDRFEQMIKKYGHFDIKIIRNKDNGIYDGMHQGFINSSGEYLQILNSDDVFANSNIIETYINHIKKTNSDAYYSNIKIVYPNNHNMIRIGDANKLRYRACINHTSLVLKKDVYFSLGGFDLSFKASSDYDLTIRIEKEGYKYEHLDLLCVLFRAEGLSNSRYDIKMLIEALRCRSHYCKFNILGYSFCVLQYIKFNINKIISKLLSILW